jgi:hypothetical protein
LILILINEGNAYFNEFSDVWAFAITVCEMYESGENPFGEAAKGRCIQWITNQMRGNWKAKKLEALELSTGSETVTALLTWCLRSDPNLRPKFSTIDKMLCELYELTEYSNSINNTASPPVRRKFDHQKKMYEKLPEADARHSNEKHALRPNETATDNHNHRGESKLDHAEDKETREAKISFTSSSENVSSDFIEIVEEDFATNPMSNPYQSEADMQRIRATSNADTVYPSETDSTEIIMNKPDGTKRYNLHDQVPVTNQKLKQNQYQEPKKVRKGLPSVLLMRKSERAGNK